MRGKYEKKRKKKTGPLLIAVAVCAVVLIGLALFVVGQDSDEPINDPATENESSQAAEQTQPGTTEPADVNTSDQSEMQALYELGYDVKVTGFLSYTGAFMEDRTDEVVTDVLAIQVTNSGDKYIQTMNITLTAGETEAQFSLSTLFPGETVVVLEKNRMAYSTAPEFEQAQASAVALFDEYPGMCEDKLEIQCLDGVINVTNISDEDITGDILIYYKNYVSGMYYGGITYRIRMEGGLKAGEIQQGTAAHFNPDNSVIVFVMCG